MSLSEFSSFIGSVFWFLILASVLPVSFALICKMAKRSTEKEKNIES